MPTCWSCCSTLESGADTLLSLPPLATGGGSPAFHRNRQIGYNFVAMHVRINGTKRELPENTTLLQLLQERGIDPRTVVVEYNYEIIPRERYPEIALREGDNLEIVQMVAGG